MITKALLALALFASTASAITTDCTGVCVFTTDPYIPGDPVPTGCALYRDGVRAQTTPLVNNACRFEVMIPNSTTASFIARFTYESGDSNTLVVTSIAPPTNKVGETTVLPALTTLATCQLAATYATLTAAAVAKSLSVYVSSAPSGSQLVLAVYDESLKLVASTDPFAPKTNWNTVDLAADTPLPAGNYWVAVKSIGTRNILGRTGTTAGVPGKLISGTCSLPATIPTQTTGYHWSIYMSVQ